MRGLATRVAVHPLVMRILHFGQAAVARLDRAGHGDTVALVELPRDKRLVEPRDAHRVAAVVADDRLRQFHPLEFGDLGSDRGNRAHHCRLHPDGKRFAVLKAPGTEQTAGVNKVSFIFNFFDELRRKVPSGK